MGTISPWSSKATDIAQNCGLFKVKRIERGIAYYIQSILELAESDLKKIDLSTADIGIEFTNPKSAFENISFCLKKVEN